MNGLELVEVTLRLPKKLVSFLEAQEDVLGESKEEYLERSVVGVVCADLNAEGSFAPTPGLLVKKFGLEEIYKVTCNGFGVETK